MFGWFVSAWERQEEGGSIEVAVYGFVLVAIEMMKTKEG